MGYFEGMEGYFGGLECVSCAPRQAAQRAAGLGLSPDDVQAQAGGNLAQAQNNAAQLQANGQQLYTTANQIAAQGTGVANGNLQSIVASATLTANNVPAGQVQSMLKAAAAAAGGTATTAGILTAATAWLVTNGFLIAGSAAAAAIPVFGTAVVAMVLAMQFIVAQWGASSPTTPTPAVVQALLAVPLPTPATVTAQGVTPSTSEPPLNDPTVAVTAGCETNDGAGTIAGALAAWRDFLDMAANPTQQQPTAQRGNNPYPPFSGSGFSLGCASWQACADAELTCVGYTIPGGQPAAEAAIALAVRWVPLGDPWIAPYQDTFSSMGSGANQAGWNLENKLIALAYTFAAWPQAVADQQALAYLTSLAWVWNNFPGAPAGPLPGWIAYKLGHLQMLVATDALIQPAADAGPSAAQVGTAVALGGLGAAAAGVAIYGYRTGQPMATVLGKAWGALRRMV
jgi:hypothetical protein